MPPIIIAFRGPHVLPVGGGPYAGLSSPAYGPPRTGSTAPAAAPSLLPPLIVVAGVPPPPPPPAFQARRPAGASSPPPRGCPRGRCICGWPLLQEPRAAAGPGERAVLDCGFCQPLAPASCSPPAGLTLESLPYIQFVSYW